MIFKSRLMYTVCAVFLSLGLIPVGAFGATVTLSDYLVTPNPGDSWTYRTTMDSTIYLSGGEVFFPAGSEFTVTEPWYVDYTLLPSVAETGQAIPVNPPDESIYLDFIPELTVPAGTFNNVLMMAWLDNNYVANSVNTYLGIDPSIDEGVTDVTWYALGIGEIGGIGVMAESGELDAAWELISYSVVPVPAAVWLFGSGLIGLIGIARRKKS